MNRAPICWAVRGSLARDDTMTPTLRPNVATSGQITKISMSVTGVITCVRTCGNAANRIINVYNAKTIQVSAVAGAAAVEPGMFGLGPVPAVRQALQRAGWDIGSIERAEINEAFAAIAIVVARELGLPEDIVNVEGGAVAHGHPIGATGAVLTTKLIHSMRRDGLTRGLVTACIGGGQGIALTIEALH